MKYKKFLLIITIITLLFTVTGCSQDNMDNINIIVTNYPNEYVLKELYSEHATISSIYPDGVDIDNYKIGKKQKEKYAKEALFVYNGLIEKERNLALDLLSINSELKIIDTAYVLETDYSPEELWLNPSSLLMMAQNVKIGLQEYVTSSYINDEIEKNYEELKINLSELDSAYRLTIKNTENKTIVVDNSALKFLEKFDLNVICIDADANEKTLEDVQNLITNKEISYIFSFEGQKENKNTKDLLEKNSDLKVLKLHKLNNLTDKERADKEDYISLMNKNLELIKQELYQQEQK